MPNVNIAKVVFKENASATPEVWMDTTQKTVTSGSMLSGTTALKNDGTDITGSIATKTSSNMTASGATVTAPAGYYAQEASKSVASGTEGTPTATKGTVSNHSVSVTPSVTNTAGYISGSTKTGTAVTVTVAELESGTKEITENGTDISVSGYSTVDVNVPSGGGNVWQDGEGYIVLDSEGSGTGDNYSGDMMKALLDRSIKSFSFPEGITKIGAYAFASCGYLLLTSLPNTITRIYDNAFYYCTSLGLTSLPSGITNIGTYAFYQCYNIALTSLPTGLTEISGYSFQGCTQITLTSLPSGVTKIGSYAFASCPNITLQTLPNGVTSIGSGAFAYCIGITSISCDGAITTLSTNAFTGSSINPMALTSASFPNMALTSNLSYAFGSTTAANACQLLAFADIGSTQGIAANAFANCYALQTLVLRRSDAICSLANVSAFLNTPLRGYNSLTGTVYVPNDLISSYQTATNWSTLYNDGTVTFQKIEGSAYDRS